MSFLYSWRIHSRNLYEDCFARLHHCPAKLDRLLISIHIPKTAGTSFRMILRCALGQKILFDYGRSSPMTSSCIQKYIHAVSQPDASALQKQCRHQHIQCIHGHFLAQRYLEIFPIADYITWLRDPVQRVISQYYYQKQSLDPNNEINTAVYHGQMGIREFANLEGNQNLQSLYLSGMALEDFAFIGLCEEFELGIRAVYKMMNINCDVPRIKKSNRTRIKPFHIDSETIASIRQANQEDMALYESGKRYFHSIIEDLHLSTKKNSF